jgi:hypothetical protein
LPPPPSNTHGDGIFVIAREAGLIRRDETAVDA